MAKIISVGGIIRIKVIKKISITNLFNIIKVTLTHLSISINTMLRCNIICLIIKNYKFVIY